jgi:hypothetical protein
MAFTFPSLLPLSPLPLEKIVQLACIFSMYFGDNFFGELVANSPKITHLFGCYLSYLG